MSLKIAARRRAERGSALVLAVVLVVVLGVVGLAVVTRANKDTDAVLAKRQYDQSVACADTARELLMSQFRAYGVSPLDLTLKTKVGDKTLASGHYADSAQGGAAPYTVSGASVKSVEVAAGSGANATGVTDIANRIGRVGLGGAVYRFTVVCSAPAPGGSGEARKNEVEYLVRFGL